MILNFIKEVFSAVFYWFGGLSDFELFMLIFENLLLFALEVMILGKHSGCLRPLLGLDGSRINELGQLELGEDYLPVPVPPKNNSWVWRLAVNINEVK